MISNNDYRAYAGIGSRETPPEVIKTMEELGRGFATLGYVLRSGGASGADSAFERGCDSVSGKKEIFLPWRNFNENKSCLFSPPAEAFSVAQQHHPRWDLLSPGSQRLMARNSQQVLGEAIKVPSLFIVCWTTNSGGTTQALRIAKQHKIPVFNLLVKNYSLEEIVSCVSSTNSLTLKQK